MLLERRRKIGQPQIIVLMINTLRPNCNTVCRELIKRAKSCSLTFLIFPALPLKEKGPTFRCCCCLLCNCLLVVTAESATAVDQLHTDPTCTTQLCVPGVAFSCLALRSGYLVLIVGTREDSPLAKGHSLEELASLQRQKEPAVTSLDRNSSWMFGWTNRCCGELSAAKEKRILV